MKNINNTSKEPKLEDFYDEQDPRGCSSSEYSEYLKALKEYDEKIILQSIKTLISQVGEVEASCGYFKWIG